MTRPRRAATLVQQLLDFSRRSPSDPTARTRVLGYRSGMSCDGTLPESIEVTVEGQADKWFVNVDPGRIRQALLNLATNARDAMPDGGELLLELRG